MNQKQAIAKLKKIVGPKLAWRTDPKALCGEDRAEALADRKTLQQIRDEARAAVEARRNEVLAADEKYQALKCALERANSVLDRNACAAFSRRVTIGKVDNLAGFSAFRVMAEGDNWQEVVDLMEGNAKK